MKVLGCDPGLSGACCIEDTATGERIIFDIPVFTLPRGGKNKREIDATSLAIILAKHYPIGHAFVEQVWSFPGQNSSATFAFGKTYGVILGVLAAQGVPITNVAPRAWKKALGVPAAKDGARARASQLMPQIAATWARAKDDGRAESALIALWGARTLERLSA